MSHIKRICWAGLCVVGLGVLLCLCGNSFSSNWQSAGDDAWGGTTNPTMGLSLRTLGNATLLIGFVLLAFAARAWLNAKERELVNLPKP
jgi:hypothetical protein